MADLPRTDTLTASARVALGFFGLVFSLTTLLIAARLIIVPLVVVLGVVPSRLARKAFSGEMIEFAFALAVFVLMTRRLLAIPGEITVGEDRVVVFRGWFRSREVPAGEIVGLTTGGWGDPNRFQVTVRHKGGRIALLNQFPDLPGLVAAIRALNPAVEVRGF